MKMGKLCHFINAKILCWVGKCEKNFQNFLLSFNNSGIAPLNLMKEGIF